MRFQAASRALAFLVLSYLPVFAQGGDPKAGIQQALLAKIALTTPTQDLADIATPGSVVTLEKPGLLLYSVAYGVPPQSTYKNGKIGQTFGGNFNAGMKLNRVSPGTNTMNVPQRKVAPGEKFWVTGLAVQDDGLVIQLYSDPVNNVRYFGELKFPFQKNAFPPADQMARTVTEVLMIEGGDGPGANSSQASSPQPEASVPAGQSAGAEDAPPPPQPPKTISLGQTVAQVENVLGPPQKIVKLGAKEVHYYPDMKVTFMNGKVSDVE